MYSSFFFAPVYKLKTLILFFVIGLLFLGVTSSSFAASFSDVPKTHSAYNAVESLKNLSIIKGYEDGTFKPQQSVNRVEALKMILLSAKIPLPQTISTSPFLDVPADQWFAGVVQKAKEKKIVSGDGTTGKFLPTRTVTTAEFLKMVLLSFNTDISKHKGVKNVATDVSNDAWFVSYMSYAKALNLITPDAQGKLFPQKPLSREECAQIIYKLLVIEKGGNTQKYLSLTESALINVLLSISNNDIVAARGNVNSATQYSSLALKASPKKGVVQAAHEISLAMNDLVSGYEWGLKKDTANIKKFAESAKVKAGNAYGYSTSTQPIGKKIKEYADVLLQQAK